MLKNWETELPHDLFMARVRSMVTATERAPAEIAMHPARHEAKARAAAAGGLAVKLQKRQAEDMAAARVVRLWP